MRLYKIVSFIIILSFSGINLSAQSDVEGSKDHPVISRYPGSTIVYFLEEDYTLYSIAYGPETGYRNIDDWIDVEGKFTRIYYELSGTTTITQVYRNFLSALEKSKFKIIANGINKDRNVGKGVGERTWLGTFLRKNPFPTNSNVLLSSGSSSAGGSCYIASELSRPDGKIYLVISAIEYSSEKTVYMIDVIEETKMEDDLIQINAEEMLKGIHSDGKIALYGIYFDTDKTDIKPESESTLKEIIKLLESDKNLKLYVVGHTDMKGGFDHNMDLSKRRAASVVKELTSKYGIAANRLSSNGVGPLAPVSSNETESGRKLNRRVELVARL
ncbi:MAG: OmpA family protein [Melioribacteraceae bacterium]|nr:OmpA family protein [Melioribacteraceae bacterium]MCO6474273.1 OmpA family protein [Melioribacteraceae bacterium]